MHLTPRRSAPLLAVVAALLIVLPGSAFAHSPVGGLPEQEQAELMEQARTAVGPISAASANAGEAGPGDVTSEGFELVGHDPLLGRGMNAALAVRCDYAYVGSRTDGQPQHESPGILVVDISDPAAPEVVHEIGRPDAAEVGETSRELRVWPEQDLLVVLNFGCSSAIPACAAGEAMASRVTFFDIAGERAAAGWILRPRPSRARWSNPGAHSSVKIPGKPFALTTDEVYGDALDPITGQDHGCPWGWVRTLDIADPAAPKVLAEYKQEENDPAYCESGDGADPANTTFTSYSAHNPTLTPDLAFISWHSSGLEAVDISDPATPTRAGSFKPEPLAAVTTEDPALSAGRDKVVMWSYPIIQDGLIYVVDLRNGLYVLRYTGEGAPDVAGIGFLEGNSNLGDALHFEPPAERVPAARDINRACPEGAVPDSGRTDADGNTHERSIDCMVWWEIASGTSATTYDVASDVTRGQMATLLVGSYELVSNKALPAGGDAFSDDNGTTHEQSINKSAAAGFTAGTGAGYAPLGTTRRDQTASFLARVLDLLVAEGTTSPKQ